MKNYKVNYLAIGVIVLVIFISLGGYYLEKQKRIPSSWTVYTNKTYGYSLKFPKAYEFRPQSEKEISQLGVDTLIGIENKSERGNKLIAISVNIDKSDMSLEEYMDKNLKAYGITDPLTKYVFNGYESLLNKNQLGTNVYIKRANYVYNIAVAKNAAFDKELGAIAATFKFETPLSTAQSNEAVAILQKNLSIQYIQSVIANNGRKTYLEPQNEKGDVVEVYFIEGGFPDQHTTLIDVFMVNVKTDEILVADITNNKTISLNDWGMNIIYRFPDYGPQKVAIVLVQDGSFYGPPFDPNLYQLEVSKSEHLFARSD